MGKTFSKPVLRMESLKTIFGRIGSKTPIKNECVNQFPTSFNTYVEPFIGGGAVMLHAEFDPSVKLVMNDLDPEVMKTWQTLMRCPDQIPLSLLSFYKKRPIEETRRMYGIEIMNPRFTRKVGIKQPIWQRVHNLWREIIRTTGTYSSTGRGKIYKTSNVAKKLAMVGKYQEKLKSCDMLNECVFSVIDKYDRADTFLYLDPPYENSERLYKKGDDILDVLAKRLKSFTGKFLISINDSDRVREIFADFKIEKIRVRAGGTGATATALGSKDRDELFIKNY